MPKPDTLYGEVKLDCERSLAYLAGPGFAAASLRATGVYGDLLPNKWSGLIEDYLDGKPIPARAGTEVHGRDLAAAVRLMLEIETSRISGEVFNVSDITVDTRDILALVQSETDCRHALPPAADKTSLNRMATAKLEALGWQPGGLPLFAETVKTLARRLSPRPAQA